MTDLCLHASMPASRDLWRPSAASKLAGAVRYGAVLAVWSLLLLVRPRLAMRIYRERRSNSPLRR